MDYFTVIHLLIIFTYNKYYMELRKQILAEEWTKALLNKGAEIFLVGGIVRDHFLKIEKSKDIDIVIRNIGFNEIKEILSPFGDIIINVVGNKASVLKFLPKSTGLDIDEAIDIALPRVENMMDIEDIKKSDITNGHHVFEFNSDPMLSIETDLSRRDFTINSIAINIESGEIIDPHGGLDDLNNKIIKCTNKDSFVDDPLRMLRAIQFSSRFNKFGIESGTFLSIKLHKESILSLSGERIFCELEKIFDKGDHTKGIKLLRDSGVQSVLFPGKPRPMIPVSDVSTKADFFIHILDDVESFKNILKGPNKLETDILEVLKLNREMINHMLDSNMSSEDRKIALRVLFFNSIKKSDNILKTGKLLGELKDIQTEFIKNKFPRRMKEISLCAQDLINKGLKPGPEMGLMLKQSIVLVMGEEENTTKNLLKCINEKFKKWE